MYDYLKILDMSEDEQWRWIRPFIDADGDTYERGIYSKGLRRRVLADLAFRLRDEVCKDNHADFHEAIYDVMMKVEGHDNWATAFWGECIAKPIHWVIASLIAKDKKDA